MSNDTILETKKLTKEFKGFVAVDQVDLRVQRGTIHALIGPNGAGKTTFFNLLTKFLPPTRGSITYNGVDITHERPAQTARRGIVLSTDMVNGVSKIMAEVPLAETFGYSTDLRSMTQGQGTFTMELAKYRPVPGNIQADIIAERKAELQPA